MGRLSAFLGMPLAAGLAAGPIYAAEVAPEPGHAATEAGIPVQPGAPGGLVAVLVNKAGVPVDQAPFDNPYVSGVALQIHWADIEPADGAPDWTQLDDLFAKATKAGKWVQLLIFPGFFSPSWALAGVKTDQFPLQYGPGAGKVEALPMPWDAIYLTRWLAFVKLVADRYGAMPAFKMVDAAGPTSVSAEATLPQSGADIKMWQADGYTATKYEDAWKTVFAAYAADFPRQVVSLSFGDGIDLNDQGKIAKGQAAITRDAYIKAGMTALGHRLGLQFSNLDGTADAGGPGTAFTIGYSGQVVTGLQLRTSAANAGMGADGNPPLALRKAIDNGMRPNSAGAHITYLEIYEPDILAGDLQTTLQYGAALFNGTAPAKIVRPPPGDKHPT
jgi:hypothetical protein